MLNLVIQMMMRTADCQTMVELAPFGLMVEVALYELDEVAFHKLIELCFHNQQKGILISCFQEIVVTF